MAANFIWDGECCRKDWPPGCVITTEAGLAVAPFPTMNPLSRRRAWPFLAIASLLPFFATGQTASPTFYGLSKGLNYSQTSAAAPALHAQPGRFETVGNQAGSLTLPNGTTRTYTAGNGLDQRFATQAAMDAAFPAGTYTLTVGSVSGISLTLPANPYPADIPRVTNGTWNAAGRLIVDPTRDYTITINPFTGFNPPGGLGNMYLSIWFGDDDDLVAREQFSFEHPSPFTTVTIPAGTLVAGRNYNAKIGYFASATVNRTSIPGAFGAVIGANETVFEIAAVNPPNSAPTIPRQPAAQAITAGGTVVFSVEANGFPAPTYQWRRGTTALAGETRSTLVLSGAAATAGDYNVVVTNSVGTITSANAALTVSSVAPADAGRLINLSILNSTGPGAQLLTIGATVGGQNTSGPLPLLIRGVGPSLGIAPFNIPGVLPDPVLSIFPAGATTASATNDNWGGTAALSAAFSSVGAFALPAASLDSALQLNPNGGGFTAQVAGKANASGTVIAEVYDASGSSRTATTPRLINLSTLTSIPASGTLAAGFVIGGSSSRTVLVRAAGPTLGTSFNISGAMSDPRLELFNNNTGEKIAENDNWQGASWLVSANAAVGAFPLSGGNTKDAALAITLAPGAYSARVSGLNGGAGTAIIEVYEVP